MQILKGVDIGHDAAGCRIVLQIKQDTVHLVKHTFLILVLHAQLVTVGLTNGAVFLGPLVPNMAAQITDTVGLLLPDPQQFIQGGLPVGAAQGHQRKFFLQIIAVDHTEFLYGMGRSTILPMGADLQIGVIKAILQNVFTSLDIQLVSSAHAFFSFIFRFPHCTTDSPEINKNCVTFFRLPLAFLQISVRI